MTYKNIFEYLWQKQSLMEEFITKVADCEKEALKLLKEFCLLTLCVEVI